MDTPKRGRPRKVTATATPSKEHVQRAYESGKLLEVPFGTAPGEGYIGRDMRYHFVRARLTHMQGNALKCVTLGLREQHETLENGKHVETGADAVRWMLEHL